MFLIILMIFGRMINKKATWNGMREKFEYVDVYNFLMHQIIWIFDYLFL